MSKVLIGGAGTIGSNVLLHLIYALPEIEFTVFDFDKVEKHNLVNQPYGSGDVGSPKVTALMGVMSRKKLKFPKVVNKRFSAKCDTSIRAVMDSEFVIDAFDNWESRNDIHTLAVDLEKPIVHLGFERSETPTATILWNDAYKPTKNGFGTQDPCDLSQIEWWLTGAAALMAKNSIDFVRSGKTISVLIKTDLSFVRL